ncbi:MAG: hypothetical protein A3F84_07605 [Candidatus Handelsmanbacteria bacterium RIFCSPLOWO2_12_FULL_64_10]|uniref:RNA polymerase sigma-70 region 2 domain-containing protein n=1 Tax=Handelsmanbacteria sp. (strain RIFCSPLOWO2_12_FULL_64_10) TaxID=1817868 RepID=A0A1F6CRV4_HANXR|nr:MAG: hypothetical protein A3F84_07605 [Candidatus Handelsmanbacteria bacterium RIFCSPLOWO2_12_FULL_64_10]
MTGVAELETFARRLTEVQSRLWAFVYSLLADADLARDVFQETNRVLWEKRAEYDPSRDFAPWAFGVAKMQVRAARQKLARERLVFDGDVVDRLAETARQDDRQAALAHCLEKLPEAQRELVRRRYSARESIEQIARALDRTANAVAVSIFRLRRALAECIEAQA